MGTITTTQLSWSVKGHRLLDSIDMAAHDGKTVGLLGPNGSGKSTLLRLLAGLRRPDTGTVRYDDTSLDDLSRRVLARRLAVVEQDVSAHHHVNVRQVVELGRTPFRGRFDALTEHDRRIVDAALERTDITDKQHQSWHTLSGGERQRTQLARALAQEPQEILLDEPTNHLDIRHQLELLDLLTSLDVTCVVALHDLNLAARYCDHIVILDHGQVAAAGAPEAVLTPDLIKSVYAVDVLVDREPTTGALRITYLAATATRTTTAKPLRLDA
ncbi:ABC transporter ATP-binding protein [Streptomyces chryseus]|uniref:Sugar ABC transporter substrate-binding protein n=1 Tax=Streptomyces chryseus TaxID=68186 RepID=A0ABQ3EA68_9ACTN|nr:ABC transporter ATP-binding protein [Streptomyces chryseus]GGX42423.1 sugar ABC transporter substrate-binding protein [Streptomyces chryseus]GHB31583.1 sugar ABC transporter substrate-binding protein [Streptomyces chryseus]